MHSPTASRTSRAELVNFSIVGSSADDIARSVVSQLRSNKTLSALPTQMKISMIRALLDADWTGDDDEQTILAILGDPTNGARTQAEFFAMYGGVGHQDYQDNIDGQENNDMYTLLKRMSFQRPNADPRTSTAASQARSMDSPFACHISIGYGHRDT